MCSDSAICEIYKHTVTHLSVMCREAFVRAQSKANSAGPLVKSHAKISEQCKTQTFAKYTSVHTSFMLSEFDCGEFTILQKV